jgi:hypothetical protein
MHDIKVFKEIQRVFETITCRLGQIYSIQNVQLVRSVDGIGMPAAIPSIHG